MTYLCNSGLFSWITYASILSTWTACSSLAKEIDLQNMPRCAWGNCFPYHSSAIGCVAITHDCFCNALAPINCTAQNCTGSDWYAVEDWFNDRCGAPQIETLQQFPQCGRACVRDAVIPDYCQSQLTRNCFCRLESVFENLAPCLVDGCGETIDVAKEIMHQFYRKACIYEPPADGDDETGGSDEVVESPKEDGVAGDSSNINKVGLIVGLVSGFIAIIVFIVSVWKWCGRHTAAVSYRFD